MVWKDDEMKVILATAVSTVNQVWSLLLTLSSSEDLSSLLSPLLTC